MDAKKATAGYYEMCNAVKKTKSISAFIVAAQMARAYATAIIDIFGDDAGMLILNSVKERIQEDGTESVHGVPTLTGKHLKKPLNTW